MSRSMLGHLVAGLAISFASATPAPESKLSAREIAGIPLAKYVAQVTALTPEPVILGGEGSSEASGSSKLPSAIGPIAKGSGVALNAYNMVEYVTDVEISGKTYSLVIDTGSSDTWVRSSPFQCLDLRFNTLKSEADCKLGAAFVGNFSGGLVPNVKFRTAGWETGPYLQGVMGYSDIKVAGVHLPKQQIALAQGGRWRGDSITSGSLGLGLPEITNALTGDNKPLPYDSFVSTMAKANIPPLFALALSRNKSSSLLSLGGAPDINTETYATAKFNTTSWPGRYVITIDSLQINGTTRSAVTRYRPLPFAFLLDSGTTLNTFPTEFADFINTAFDPPATYDPTENLYFARCNAKPPALTFEIGGVFVKTDPASMILPQIKRSDGLCATGVTVSTENEGDLKPDLFVLGNTFLQELVVLFDVEKREARIARRK